MIIFNYEIDFSLSNEEKLAEWLITVIKNEGYEVGDISYVFCNDDYLLKINRDYLNHDTLTDIISFDYSIGKNLQGDIFISVDRVKENALKYSPNFETELTRVMVHGILHFCGYKDKSDDEKTKMRQMEDHYLHELA